MQVHLVINIPDSVRNPVSKLNEMAINGGGEGKC